MATKIIKQFVEMITSQIPSMIPRCECEDGFMYDFRYGEITFEVLKDKNGELYANIKSIGADLGRFEDGSMNYAVPKDKDLQSILDDLFDLNLYKHTVKKDNYIFCELSLAGDFLWDYRRLSFVKWIQTGIPCPDEKGYIYAFCGYHKDKKKHLIKIGRSTDIKNRIRNHNTVVDIVDLFACETLNVKSAESRLKELMKNFEGDKSNEWFFYNNKKIMKKNFEKTKGFLMEASKATCTPRPLQMKAVKDNQTSFTITAYEKLDKEKDLEEYCEINDINLIWV